MEIVESSKGHGQGTSTQAYTTTGGGWEDREGGLSSW